MVHVIKVYFSDSKNQTTQVRRVAVSSNITTYFKLLQEKIQELFQLPTDNFEIKWKDSDGDYIIVSSDGELAQALANAEEDMLRIYTNMRIDENTIPKRPETPPKGEVEHPHIVCDSCNKSPVTGDRYKCLQCVNFDLCSSCNAANKHPGHDMIKLVIPSHIPREWVFIGARKFWRSLFGRCPSSFFAQFKEKKESESAKTPESPESDAPGFNHVLSEFLKGDFVEAQKLLGGFMKDISGNIQVQMENYPFNADGTCKAEGNVKVPKTKVTNSTSTDNAAKKDAKPAQANEKVEAQVQTKSTEAKEKNLEAPSVLIESTVAPKESTKAQNEDEICIDAIKEKSPSPDTEASTCAEGWTLLDDLSPKEPEPTTEKKTAEPEKIVKYPDLEELKQKSADCGDAVQTSDPKIINALIKMQAMGFTNEGGWLERLLSTKHGNINEALDALYPFAQRH